ncbi:hypothetical protein [Halorarius litoreus]|uniref:hypothetical protein n=1 Tax=Halorarius litoreus TaxID=2962676 RepID=UPI0020CB90B1|nr:hypothetical protein [Halorarius litoreus]
MTDPRPSRSVADGSRETVATHAAGVGGFLLVYLFLVRDITLGRLYAFGDLVPYYGLRAFEKFTGTWHAQQLGFPYIYNVMPAYLGAVTSVGGALGQNLFYLALVPAGFLTFLVFAGRFVERPAPRYLAAGVYAINPLTIGEFVNGGVSTLIGFAGYPLVLHFLYEVDERDEWRPVLLGAMVFGATAVVPWLVFWMVGPFAVYFALRARDDPRKLVKFVTMGLLGVLLSLPNVHHILQRAAGFGEGDAVLRRTLEWNYAQADPLAVVRLAGNHGILAMNELGYNTEPTMAIGLVVPAMALLAIGRERLTVYVVTACGCVLFIVATGLELTYPLFDAVPLFWSVRNPTKLQYPLLLSMSLLFGAGVEAVLTGTALAGRSTGPRRQLGDAAARLEASGDSVLRAAFVGLLVLSLVAYAMPAAGAFGLDGVRGDDYTVPAEYDQVADDLDGRVLWVPYGYTTQLRLRDTYPNHVGIKSGGVVQGIPNAGYVTTLFEDVAAGDPVHDRLTDLGVQYVVVESDPPDDYGEGTPRVQSKWGSPWLFGDPAAFDARLDDSEAYELAFESGEFSVYRVVGVDEQERVVERQGLHAAVYPTNVSVAIEGENLVANPSFDDGFEGWWTPPNTTGRETRLVATDEETAAELTVNESAEQLPIAQGFTVREGYPYQLGVDATGAGVATLYWYDGEKSPDSLVRKEVVPLSALPVVRAAAGDTLSVRIKPNVSSTIRIEEVRLRETSYPAATGFEANTAGIPGVVVDGTDDPPANATTVAVNLDPETAAAADADVRIVDAETVLDGPLVFSDTYRQGAGVRLDDGERPARVPDDARMVTHETAAGTVLDYWVVGTFDETPVTVVHTSYDEGWVAPQQSTHFRAQGWANGFTDTDASQIQWSGGGLRTVVLWLWLAAWAGTLLALLAAELVVRRRSDTRSTHPLGP